MAIRSNYYPRIPRIYSWEVQITKRVKNKKDEINKERINQGKRPYESSTLKTKVSGMDIIEELGMLKELNEIVIGMLSEKEPSIAI